MKSYIFLTPNITKIGGAQMYLKYKSEWLLNKGYVVKIISSKKGSCIINGLERYEDYIIEGLSFPPHSFYNKKVKSIKKELLKIIGDRTDEMIIESTSIAVSVWGELLAKYYNAKHLVYSLQEKNEVQNPEIYNFLEFKNMRRELAGIKPQSIPKIFNSESANGPYLRAYALKIPEDYDHYLIKNISPADFTIGSIGRLDKPFVVPLIKKILSFTRMYSNKSFNLLMIGGSENLAVIRALKKMVRNTSNIRIYITGFVYPIPLKLIQMPDVFISSSGSCRVSSQQNKLTISIDADDYKPIGIIGITTKNGVFRDGEPEVELSDLLQEILIDQKYKPSMIKGEKPLSIVDYSDHLEFIDKSDKKKEYYNFKLIGSMNRYKKLLLNLVGSEIYKSLHLKKHFFN